MQHVGRRPLIIFDYDWSLVNENSDTFVVKELGSEETIGNFRHRRGEKGWTELMDQQMLALADEGVMPARILEKLAKIPVQPGMLDALRFAVLEHGCRVKIVSDANVLFIETMLVEHGLKDLIDEIVTNFAEIVEHSGGGESAAASERIRISPFHGGHSCRKGCPTNLCKGLVLDRIRREEEARHSQVMYVGDGGGDFCPSTLLTGERDIVLARRDPDREYGLTRRIEADREKTGDERLMPPEVRVVEWSTGEDVFRLVREWLATADY